MTINKFNSFVDIQTEKIELPKVSHVAGINGCILCSAFTQKSLPEIVRQTFYSLLAQHMFFLSFHQLTPDGIADVDSGAIDFSNKNKLFTYEEQIITVMAQVDLRDYISFLFTTMQIKEAEYLNKHFYVVDLTQKNWGIKLKEYLDGRF
jgi:hypothetical protein